MKEMLGKTILTLLFATWLTLANFVAGSHFQRAMAQSQSVGQLKGLRDFFDRHPRIRKAAKAAAVGATLGTGLGIVTGGSIAGKAAMGAGRSAAVSGVRTSKTWGKVKSKITRKSD